jgi:ribosomal protein S18 acetylase RimI-like enzyme
MTARYQLHGLRIHSAVPLNAPPAGDIEAACDLLIEFDDDTRPILPPEGERLAGYDSSNGQGYVVVDAGDEYRFVFHRTAEFRISRDLSVIRARLAPGVDPEIASLLITGTLLAAVRTLAGDLVLHASAVEIGGRALAFSGDSGMGKSTLAAALCTDGARLVSDDLLRLEPGDGGWRCHAGPDEVRLRPGAVGVIPQTAWRGSRTTVDNRVAARLEAAAPILPLAAIVVPRLSRQARTARATRLTRPRALMWLMACPRVQGLARVDLIQQQLSGVGRLTASVPVFEVVVPWQRPCPSGLLTELMDATARGETPDSFRIRDATADDLPALARLHADIHNDTRGLPPERALSAERAETYWREALASAGQFCLIVEAAGAFVGFAGVRVLDSPHPGGQLDWIYLLPQYQRAGLGSRLLAEVCRRLLERNARSLLALCRRENPSQEFFRAWGAARVRESDTSVYLAFGWHDLESLRARCESGR